MFGKKSEKHLFAWEGKAIIRKSVAQPSDHGNHGSFPNAFAKGLFVTLLVLVGAVFFPLVMKYGFGYSSFFVRDNGVYRDLAGPVFRSSSFAFVVLLASASVMIAAFAALSLPAQISSCADLCTIFGAQEKHIAEYTFFENFSDFQYLFPMPVSKFCV